MSTHQEEPHDESSVKDDMSESNLSQLPRGERVETPRPMDIICGRGSRITHPGNKRFRQLIMDHKESYQRSTRRDEKTRITLHIVQKLVGDKEPSRFLLKSTKDNCWYDVGLYYAKEKVSHALRSRPTEDRRKRVKPKKQVVHKPAFSPELEDVVQGMIADQQSLLQTLIEKEASNTGRSVHLAGGVAGV